MPDFRRQAGLKCSCDKSMHLETFNTAILFLFLRALFPEHRNMKKEKLHFPTSIYYWMEQGENTCMYLTVNPIANGHSKSSNFDSDPFRFFSFFLYLKIFHWPKLEENKLTICCYGPISPLRKIPPYTIVYSIFQNVYLK